MKISKQTMSILKNFASVNTNIVFKEGNKLATISSGLHIFATAEIEESFPKEFPVYDLNSLLGVLSIMEDDSELSFGDESLTIKTGRSLFEYYYSDPDVVDRPAKDNIDVVEYFSFDMSEDRLAMIMKAAAITAAPMFSIIGDGKEVTLSVGDPSTPNSNSYKTVIGESDKIFKAHLAIENLRVLSGDYKVIVTKQKFIHFINDALKVKYWIALDKTSEI